MNEAKIIYGLLHAIYINTDEGQEKMLKKFHNHEFHACPRTLCKDYHCIPFGPSYTYGEFKVQLFCPNCTDSYDINDRSNILDGSFFGPDWFHFLLANHHEDPELFPPNPPENFVPKIYGFRIYNRFDHPVSS